MSSTLGRIRALVLKDFRIHGRDILVTQCGLFALIGVLTYLEPAEPSLLASAIFNFNFLLAAFWSEWLISREKVKGTFAWLRACPIDDRELVSAKFVAVAICTTPLWVATSVIFTGAYWFPGRTGAWITLHAVLLAFGALAVASRWRFGQKLGQMLPFLLLAVVMGVFIVASRQGQSVPVDPEILLRSTVGQVMLASSALVAYAGIVAWTLRWVRRSDTATLLE